MTSALSGFSAFSTQFGPVGPFCMTTGKTYDNSGPALWRSFRRHTDFTRRQASAWKRLKGGLATSGLARRSGTGQPDRAPLRRGFPDGVFLTKTPKSQFEGGDRADEGKSTPESVQFRLSSWR